MYRSLCEECQQKSASAATEWMPLVCDVELVWLKWMASALDDVQRETRERRFFIARLHVETGLIHGLDDLIE